MSDEADWRLTSQETWLSGRTLKWSRWSPYREGWDHDHCAFCWAEISTLVGGHADADAGYVTADDNYTWICESCFQDFGDRFQWTVDGDHPIGQPDTTAG